MAAAVKPPRGPSRLLQVFPGESKGGVERYALVVAAAAVREGWEVHAAFPRRDATTGLREEFANCGASTHTVELPDLRYRTARTLRELLPPLLRTGRLLARIRPDVVHLNLPWPDHAAGAARACGLAGVPAAVVFHLAPEEFPVDRFRVRQLLSARAAGQQWVTVSLATRAILARWFAVPPGEILHIPNGIPRSAAPLPTPEERIAARDAVLREFGWAPDTRILLTTARLDAQKGFGDLLAAAPVILAKHPGARFLWAGGGDVPTYAGMVERAGLGKTVRLAGFRSDVPRLLAAADLFLFPTRFEGLPFAVLEAMAAGLPVVSTRANGVTEIIENGQHGLLAPVADPAGLAAAAEEALGDPDAARTRAMRAQDRVREFSEETMIRRTLDLLAGLAGRKGAVGEEGIR